MVISGWPDFNRLAFQKNRSGNWRENKKYFDTGPFEQNITDYKTN